ncbi:hypothetical protein [Psychrobacter sp. ASPA161_9]|uniref:hypothetical protein n=1 Tax=Psychrobacter sp. ASPA161_9 TaxID=3160961 RepID=UPI003F7E4E10
MKKALLLLFFISSTALADTSCKDTTEYKFYNHVSSVSTSNLAIEANEESLEQYEGMRPTHQVNEAINTIKKDINLAIWLRNHSFAEYKKMGGKASNYNSLERLKNPCANEYSDDSLLVQLRRDFRDREVYIKPEQKRAPVPSIGEYTGEDEYVLTDFGLGENRNGRYGEGNGRKSNTDRQGNGQSDLQKTIESGLSLYELFKR